MRMIELEIEGVTALARLLDDGAPRTCQALWDILPFESLVTHSRWSGSRLHTRTHPELDIGPVDYPFIENPSAYQAPGDVVIWPLDNELMVIYSPGKFQRMGQHWPVTHVASIEGDMAQFADKIERLQWDGARKLIIRRGAAIARPKPAVVKLSTRFQIECDGKTWVAELFKERVPHICKAFLDALPLAGPITNTHGSGDMIHFWARVPNAPLAEKDTRKRDERPIEYQGKQVGISYIAYFDPQEMRGLNPGDIFLHSMGDIRLVHGQSFQASLPVKFGRIVEGSIMELHEIADRIEMEGAKTMRMTKLV